MTRFRTMTSATTETEVENLLRVFSDATYQMIIGIPHLCLNTPEDTMMNYWERNGKLQLPLAVHIHFATEEVRTLYLKKPLPRHFLAAAGIKTPDLAEMMFRASPGGFLRDLAMLLDHFVQTQPVSMTIKTSHEDMVASTRVGDSFTPIVNAYIEPILSCETLRFESHLDVRTDEEIFPFYCIINESPNMLASFAADPPSEKPEKSETEFI